MEPSIYSYSLCIALPLMSFFGFYFLLASTPGKAIFNNYLRSRRIMGVAILLLAANYSVHFFFGIRFKNTDAAILMNLATYFLCYWLFSSALTTLLDRFYITKRRLRTHICLWILFSILSGIVLLLLPKGGLQTTAMFALAAWLVFGRTLSVVQNFNSIICVIVVFFAVVSAVAVLHKPACRPNPIPYRQCQK